MRKNGEQQNMNKTAVSSLWYIQSFYDVGKMPAIEAHMWI